MSATKLFQVLRDRYYLGYVAYHGQEYPDRHQPNVDLHLFTRVQEILESRGSVPASFRATTQVTCCKALPRNGEQGRSRQLCGDGSGQGTASCYRSVRC